MLARHLYQSNISNLAVTGAPLCAECNVERIEQQKNHLESWQSAEHAYRIVFFMSGSMKFIYTNELDICTGLGAAKNIFPGNFLSSKDFTRLNRMGSENVFCPLIDGNQYILTDAEERSPGNKVVIVYGGGGTAAACYRKAFFGHDVRTEDRPFDNESRKNTVYWIAAKSFSSAGSGKLAMAALSSSEIRNERLSAELIEIKINPFNGKLETRFRDTHIFSEFNLECDQFVYSIGQDDIASKEICTEINDGLQLTVDSSNMPLYVATSDDKIRFWGAAAMAIRAKEYSDTTWSFLHENNIGPDVGPGSMPPSRAQIRKYVAKDGFVESVNVNMDNLLLIQQFLRQVGVEEEKSSLLISEILIARKDSTAGLSLKTLQKLLDKYNLDDKVKIFGHSTLIPLH